MSDPLLIYGATGFSGRLMAEAAVACGLEPILGGRNAAKLEALASDLGLAYRAVALSDERGLVAALRDVGVVLHAAGPFSATAAPMLEACLAARVHYLDISGEIDVIEALVRRGPEARRRGIMVMPGTGFDVVPSDCLAAHVAGRARAPRRLSLGLTGLGFATRGSARTLAEHAGQGVRIRRGGAIVSIPAGSRERVFDFGSGPRDTVNMSWGDVATAYYTTGIRDVEVYFEATPSLRGMLLASRLLGDALASAPAQAWLKAHAALLPEGPTREERAGHEMVIVAEVEARDGKRSSARLRTPEAYSFTAATGPAIARRVLEGDLEPGFQTPARVYGADLVLGFAGVSREDLEPSEATR